MDPAIASIRDLRINFRAVKRKIEQHGEIVITDNGVPSYVLKLMPRKINKQKPPPDYWARLLKQQPKSMSAREAAALHAENCGDR